MLMLRCLSSYGGKNIGRNKSNHKYEYLMIKRWAFALISSPLTVVVPSNGWYTTTERCNKWNNLVRNSQMLKCVCPHQLRATPERASKEEKCFFFAVVFVSIIPSNRSYLFLLTLMCAPGYEHWFFITKLKRHRVGKKLLSRLIPRRVRKKAEWNLL